jgi:hypothetical protein
MYDDESNLMMRVADWVGVLGVRRIVIAMALPFLFDVCLANCILLPNMGFSLARYRREYSLNALRFTFRGYVVKLS